MVSWRSNALSPEGYEGRVGAPIGGSVLLLAEALVNGRPTDLRGYEVRWYVNDELYQSGMGLFSTTYRVPSYSQPSIDVRVEIVNAPFSANEASMTVPFSDPIVVIEAPGGPFVYPGDTFFYATPYSFNVGSANDILYTWTVNGEVPDASGDPRELSIGVDGTPTQRIRLGITAESSQSETEFAEATLDLNPAQ